MYKTAVLISLILVGCVPAQHVKMRATKIQEPKVVALDAPREPYTLEIEKRLKDAGYKVLRLPARKVVREQTSETRTEVYREAEARYVVYLDASIRDRCFAGGYNFANFTAELVDTTTNETVISFSDNGYSENCTPLSGDIYAQSVKAIEDAWQK